MDNSNSYNGSPANTGPAEVVNEKKRRTSSKRRRRFDTMRLIRSCLYILYTCALVYVFINVIGFIGKGIYNIASNSFGSRKEEPTYTDPVYDNSPVNSGVCGDDLYWELEDNGNLNITGTGTMFTWNSSSDVPWNEFRYSIKSVSLSDDTTSIGNYAFTSCVHLSEISFPRQLTYIGNSAFQNTDLIKIYLPNNLTEISRNAFKSCMSLETVSIANSVKTIGDSAFEGCTKLKTISFSTNMTSIGDYAFSECFGLENIELPKKLTKIGTGAFGSCTHLAGLTIPSSVTTIGNSAFAGCLGLKKVAGGAKVVSIGNYAFSNCPELKSFTINSSGLKKIGAYAFSKDKNLGTIVLPKTTKLTKSGVKDSLKDSNVSVVKVKKSKVKKYKKFFKTANSGKSVKVKKK